MSTKYICLETLAPSITCGKPYIIKYENIQGERIINGQLHICNNLQDIRELIIDEIYEIKKNSKKNYEIVTELSSMLTINIFNIGDSKDTTILKICLSNELDLITMDSCIKRVIDNLF